MTSFPALHDSVLYKAAKRTMIIASDRFVKFSNNEIQSLSEEQENTNTKKKTSYDVKLFNEFLSCEEQERKNEEIPAEELQGLAIKFVLGASGKKKWRRIWTFY